MKFTKQDLLTLLIGLFLFASCKNPDGVGLDVDPNSAIVGTLVSNEPISSQTVKENDVITAGLARHPLGYIVDPIFGKTESSLAMTVTPSSTSYDFGTSPVLDSAVLVLNLGTQFYGDTASTKYSIDVYQLTNKITTYKSSDIQVHNSTLLGNFNSKIFPKTPIKIFDIVEGKADTLKIVPAQIRIPLNTAFIQSTILSLPTTGTSTNAKFIDYFKGLYAEVNKTSTTGTGGIAFIDFAGTNSYLQLVYKKTNTSSGIDTVSVNFPINNSAGTVTANIKHDYTGTEIATQLLPANASTQYNVTYLQALAGVKTKISFPTLADFTNKYGKVVVNKAELVVDLSSNTFGYPFVPAQRLSLYRWDIAEQPTNVPDHNQGSQVVSGDPRALSDGVFGGYYDSLKNRYVFVVTAYVQDLIDKKLTDFGTFLAPTSLTEFQVTPSVTSAGRAVIGSAGNTTNKLKLNIYYTKIN
ncbi:DUF4270 family protein [Pedobacter chinensis]|uniref:DUF4270 family protein n=1 Tax=Pedobacter chinensis TaxID=2282421 RepID=A0A369PQA2_9SPHI|nr:DUF4270 domain-containing protein [Pedobacter chinensis]RDC54734.1 DUF4270 family protein [Pedobacter chinensis]